MLEDLTTPPKLRPGPRVRPGFALPQAAQAEDSASREVASSTTSPGPEQAGPQQPEVNTPPASATPRIAKRSSLASTLGDSAPQRVLSASVEAVQGGRPLAADSVAPISEVISHAAMDSIFFSRTFFKKTFRQPSPLFHRQIWALLDDPQARYVNVQVQRDGAKTTLLRTYAAKRVAYGISRTILYVGASQDKAKQSIKWVKRQIQSNHYFSSTFGLAKGKSWSDEQLEVLHGAEGHSVWLLALGITGSTRGINIDDYRPDLIIVDDVMNEENSATPEQRLKISNLVLGALKESLSPASETPDAKMVLLNTPQDFEDLSVEALRDPQFRSARFGCWTPETENLPIEYQQSAWEERYPTEVLRKEKLSALARNKYSIFAREKECLLVTPETSAFKAEWIRYFGDGEREPEPPRHEMRVVLVIDPVAPPTDLQISKGLLTKDFEAHSVLGRYQGKYYVLETIYNRGHTPEWTIATFFELCNRWNPSKVIVETVAYQKTLSWLLKKAMQKAGRYWLLEEFKDKRAKIVRIKQGLTGPLAENQLYLRRSQSTAISQIIHYPGKNPEGTHDDVIETLAIGCESLSKGFVGEVESNGYEVWEKDIPALEYARGAP